MLDDDGLLRYRGRWTAVTDSQLPVVALLVRNHRRLTRHHELIEAYASAGGSPTVASLRSLLHRLRARFTAVGLQLYGIPRHGVMLDVMDDP